MESETSKKGHQKQTNKTRAVELDGEMNEYYEERERTSAIMKVFPSTGSAHKDSVYRTPLTLQEIVFKKNIQHPPTHS